MKPLSVVLMLLWLVLAVYTALVVGEHGLNLFPFFFGDMVALGWPGQFNLDFMLMLLLSAVWTAWRNGFGAAGWLLAVPAFFGGAGFLLPYLTYLA
jgi:hypothetical protein